MAATVQSAASTSAASTVTAAAASRATNDAPSAHVVHAPSSDIQAQTTVTSATAYVDQQAREALQSAQTYSDAANAQTLATANAYTNQALQGYVTTDAFNQFESQVNAHFTEVSKQIDQIGATGAAWAGMAQNTGSDDNNNVGVGIGSQGSQQALAVGYKRLLSKHASFSFGGAASGSEHSVSAGVGFHG